MRLRLLLLCFCFVMAFSGTLAAAGVTNYPALVNEDYWVKNNPSGDKLVMDSNAIAAFNKKILAASPTVTDLKNYPQLSAAIPLRQKS